MVSAGLRGTRQQVTVQHGRAQGIQGGFESDMVPWWTGERLGFGLDSRGASEEVKQDRESHKRRKPERYGGR